MRTPLLGVVGVVRSRDIIITETLTEVNWGEV